MAKQHSTPLDPKVAERLLELLSTDNEFRRLFKKNPAAALKRAGHKGAPAAPAQAELSASGSCYRVEYIAPKQEIARAREQLKTYLTNALEPTNPHSFEAGKITTMLRRVKR